MEKITNSFTSYDLNEKEALQGSIFSSLQLQCLQNQLANTAEEKIRLEFDTKDPSSFIQQEAYKRGQLDLLEHLIESSTVSEDILNNPERIEV